MNECPFSAGDWVILKDGRPGAVPVLVTLVRWEIAMSARAPGWWLAFDGDPKHEMYRAEAYMLVPITVAALFVDANGAYASLPGVDAWPEERDARRYDGPWPVVAHPPCQRWGKMWFGQPLTVKLTGVRKKKGDDGGCFAAALAAVRKFGGVLEHPWGSHAWAHFGLAKPRRSGGWIEADEFGYTCCVEQGQYGHYARKPTLLYAVGIERPELRWGHTEAKYDPAVVARMGLKRAKRLGEVGARGGGTDSTPRIHTPPEFRDLLLGMARSAKDHQAAAL